MKFPLVHFNLDSNENAIKIVHYYYELRMKKSGIPFLLIVHGFMKGIIGFPNERYDKNTDSEYGKIFMNNNLI